MLSVYKQVKACFMRQPQVRTVRPGPTQSQGGSGPGSQPGEWVQGSQKEEFQEGNRQARARTLFLTGNGSLEMPAVGGLDESFN